MNKNGTVYTLIFGFVSTFLFVVPLSVAHNLTKETVKLNSELTRQRSVLSSFGLLPPGANLDGDAVRDLFAQISTETREGRLLYKYFDGTDTFYASEFTVPGAWGPITAVVSFNPDLSRVRNFSVVSHMETPGLGARITERWFIEQFQGERFLENGTIAVNMAPKDRRNKDDGAADVITGATRTSDSMARLFRDARRVLVDLVGGLQ